MLSKASSLLLAVLLSACVVGLPSPADGGSQGVCPGRSGHKLQHIDIFDGKPEELAYLAPDDDRHSPNTYTVQPIYGRGGILTVRCSYEGGLVLDIELKKPVDKCTFSQNAQGEPSLVCK
jgi:hypothetical protein